MMPIKRKELKNRYKELFGEVSNLMNEWDPMRFESAGGLVEEYDPEVARILAAAVKGISDFELSQKISLAMRESFEDDFGEKETLEIAKKVNAAISAHSVFVAGLMRDTENAWESYRRINFAFWGMLLFSIPFVLVAFAFALVFRLSEAAIVPFLAIYVVTWLGVGLGRSLFQCPQCGNSFFMGTGPMRFYHPFSSKCVNCGCPVGGP